MVMADTVLTPTVMCHMMRALFVLAVLVAVCPVLVAQAVCSGPDPFVGRDENGQMVACPGLNGTVKVDGDVQVLGSLNVRGNSTHLNELRDNLQRDLETFKVANEALMIRIAKKASLISIVEVFFS